MLPFSIFVESLAHFIMSEIVMISDSGSEMSDMDISDDDHGNNMPVSYQCCRNNACACRDDPSSDDDHGDMPASYQYCRHSYCSCRGDPMYHMPPFYISHEPSSSVQNNEDGCSKNEDPSQQEDENEMETE